MSIFREIPPTAGFPLYLKDILSAFKPRADIGEDFKAHIGLAYARLAYSGTAALYFILETIKELSPKRTVVVPSYICPLVPLAIKRAGLKVEVCDIQPESFDYDHAQLENICAGQADIAAVIAVHLAGIPVDLGKLKEITGSRGIFIIEDCAQALGAEYHGAKAGSLGDFSFFSLCRGKGLTIYEGGIAATNRKEYSSLLDAQISRLAGAGRLSEVLKIWELLGYWLFYRPQLAWFIFRLPQFFWQLQGNRLKAVAEYFSEDFPMHRVSRFRNAVGRAAFSRLEKGIAGQRQKAAFYLDRLKDIKGVKAIKETAGMRSTYPYLTLVFEDGRRRETVFNALQRYGLGVSQVYACAITDYEYLEPVIPRRECPNGRSIARRQLTLSTSVFLSDKDMGRITDKIIAL